MLKTVLLSTKVRTCIRYIRKCTVDSINCCLPIIVCCGLVCGTNKSSVLSEVEFSKCLHFFS